MWVAATLSEAHLPKVFHVLNHFSKFNMHLRILSRADMPERITPKQARNQLGKLGGAKGFLKGPKFLIMFNGSKLCPTHFSREVKKF